MYLNCLGPVSCFSPSWIPLRGTVCVCLGVGGGCSGWWLDGRNTLCLLKWQATFFVHANPSRCPFECFFFAFRLCPQSSFLLTPHALYWCHCSHAFSCHVNAECSHVAISYFSPSSSKEAFQKGFLRTWVLQDTLWEESQVHGQMILGNAFALRNSQYALVY